MEGDFAAEGAVVFEQSDEAALRLFDEHDNFNSIGIEEAVL